VTTSPEKSQHPIIALAFAQFTTTDDEPVIADAQCIAALHKKLSETQSPSELGVACGELHRLAHYVEVEKKSPKAAKALLALVAKVGEEVAARGAAAEDAVASAAKQADKFRSFSGQGGTRAPMLGETPKGTIKAGNLGPPRRR
jgi:hypothetical protein